MAAQQVEFVVFKAEVAASAAGVAASIERLEDVVTKSNADATAASAVIAELQTSYSAISLQAAHGQQLSKLKWQRRKQRRQEP